MATLDQVSAGRIGWNMVTGSSDFAARNFGLDGLPEHDVRYDMADEYMDLVGRLWDSWEPGALVADAESGMLVDHTNVHQVNFKGRWYASRGPLNSGPCVQGRPVIAQAGGSPRGRQFAARHADTIVASVKGTEAMRAYRDDVRARRRAQGLDPGTVKFCSCMVRPERMTAGPPGTLPPGQNGVRAIVREAVFMGEATRYALETDTRETLLVSSRTAWTCRCSGPASRRSSPGPCTIRAWSAEAAAASRERGPNCGIGPALLALTAKQGRGGPP